jgi:hypothetical protein
VRIRDVCLIRDHCWHTQMTYRHFSLVLRTDAKKPLQTKLIACLVKTGRAKESSVSRHHFHSLASERKESDSTEMALQ